MSTPSRLALILLLAVSLAGCVLAPQYQPANTEQMLKQHTKLAVGPFSAAPGVEDRSKLAIYLRNALITELHAAASLDTQSDLRLTGVLTRYELSRDTRVGSVTVGAVFALTRSGEAAFTKTLVAEQENYTQTVQKLLGELFSDPDFTAALHP